MVICCVYCLSDCCTPLPLTNGIRSYWRRGAAEESRNLFERCLVLNLSTFVERHMDVEA